MYLLDHSVSIRPRTTFRLPQYTQEKLWLWDTADIGDQSGEHWARNDTPAPWLLHQIP
jgi:hypothetical protein